MYDVRALANFIIDLASSENIRLTNIQINKIVYFLYADYLVLYGRKLTGAKIEAWDYGPVFRELYHQFKRFGGSPIDGRAEIINPVNGRLEVARCDFLLEDADFIRLNAEKYFRMSAYFLVDQSHIEDGPWDRVWNHIEQASPTMKISDEIIRDWHRKVMKH
ncbi:Panacea domain-containing protein [uncultured Aureimonas sp.]|uniref:Panacea domain-containing protein n=1 Tax=uncultured Aureimonas sp. TaxID=1604662 RepID=UPI0025F1AC68|nr:type II toxin-antitoxin system antitoxin SocA domain-containing protein [uncultured Aureimonas sp.]